MKADSPGESAAWRRACFWEAVRRCSPQPTSEIHLLTETASFLRALTSRFSATLAHDDHLHANAHAGLRELANDRRLRFGQ